MRDSNSVRVIRVRSNVVNARGHRIARGSGIALHSQIRHHVHWTMHVRRRGLRADFLAIDVEGEIIRLPVHAVGVVAGRIRHLTVDLAVALPRNTGWLRVRRVNRAVDARIAVSVVLDDIKLLPSARVAGGRCLLVRLHPERVPGIRVVREISPDLEVAICLREVALSGDQARLPAARVT